MGGRVRVAFKLNVHGQRVGTPFEEYLRLARRAEDAGFDGVYVIDHLLLPGERMAGYTNADPGRPYFLDAWTTLAAVAAVTRRVKIGPQVTPIGLRHPVFVAKWGATIDHISRGRFVLGVGAGHQEIEYRSHGFPYPPLRVRVERLVEGVEIIRRLWSEDGPVTYAGAHYRISGVDSWPKPVQRPGPGIWFGGTSARIRDAVARLGDGWTPAAPQATGLDRAFYRASLAEIRQQAADAGRRGSIAGGALFYTAVSEDAEQASRAAAVLRRREDWASLSLADLTDRGVAFVGTPDAVLRGIERYVEAGVDYFTVSFVPLDDLDLTRRGLDLYAEKILPRLP